LSGETRRNTNDDIDNGTNKGKRNRLIDKPSGETRRIVAIGKNDDD